MHPLLKICIQRTKKIKMNVITFHRATFQKLLSKHAPGGTSAKLTAEPLRFPLAPSQAPALFFITGSIEERAH